MASADVPDGGYRVGAGADDDPRCREADRRVGAFSVGVLNAVTSEEQRWSSTARAGPRQTIEPLTSYSVVRARREFANQSTLGFITTATNRNLDDRHAVPARQAYTGGVDWDWRLSHRYKITALSATAASRVTTLPWMPCSSQRPQLPPPGRESRRFDDTRTVLHGHGGNLAFTKNGGERVRFTSTSH